MKRLDLQAIRGIAILLVVLFHLLPEDFTLGFVGVDIFFVLSGYLMAVILSKETLNKTSLFKFYTRRFKRIVPLYYATLILIYTGTNFLLIHPDKKQVLTDLKWVLPFAGNIEPFFEANGYWDQVTSSRFFVHCWSLGLEIQFYLIAPYIIFFSNRLAPRTRNFVLVTVILLSCTFQALTSDKVSYGLLPSRLWQFVLGMICFSESNGKLGTLCEKADVPLLDSQAIAKKNRASIWTEFSLILLVATVFWNPSFPGKEHVFRILSCILIAYITQRNTEQEKSILLSNRLLVHIGDLSYTMYLVHWPLIVAYKYYFPTFSFFDTLLLILGVFLFTFVVHYIVEKTLISSSLSTGFYVCALFAGFVVLTRHHYMEWYWSHEGKAVNEHDLDSVISWNTAEYEKVFVSQPCDPDNITMAWTNYSEDPNLRCQSFSNGSLKILIIGNSVAYRAFPKLHELLRGRYKELRLYSRSAAVPLANGHFPEFTTATHKVVEKVRPDIIWNIHGHIDQLYTGTIEQVDEGIRQFQKNLDFYSSIARTIILDLPYYWSFKPAAYHVAKRFYLNNFNLTDLRVPKSVVEVQQVLHRQRLLSLKCDNCLYTDVQERFFDKDGYYHLYNKENYRAYTGDGNHLSSEMLDRIAPVYEEVIENVFNQIS